MSKNEKEEFDPEAYYKKFQDSQKKEIKSAAGFELRGILKLMAIMTLLSIFLSFLIYIIQYLIGFPRIQIVDQMITISIVLILIPVAYYVVGMSTGMKIQQTDMTITAWTGKPTDTARSLRDLRSFLSLGRIMIFVGFMGVLDLIIFTQFF